MSSAESELAEATRPLNHPLTTLSNIELMTLLMEECAEAQQAAAKFIRFGPVAWHPLDESRESNTDALSRELGDVYAAVALLARLGVVDASRVEEAARRKLAKHLEHKTPLFQLQVETNEPSKLTTLGQVKKDLMDCIIDLEEGQYSLCYNRLRQALDRVAEVPLAV